MRTLAILTAVTLAVAALPAEFTSTPNHVTTRSGIPLGGLGTGTVELRGDGGFAEWEMFSNFNRPTTVPEAMFLARVKSGTHEVARALQLTPPAGLPGVGRIDYRGEYPYANLRYDLGADVPVHLRLQAFTPFIVHDAEASGFPGAVLRMTATNTGKAPATARLAFVMPPAMTTAGAGPDIQMAPVARDGSRGVEIRTVTGPPAKMAKPVRLLVITDSSDGHRISDFLGAVQGLKITFAKVGDHVEKLADSAAQLRGKYDVIWLAELGHARDRLGEQQMAMIRDAVRDGMGFFHSGGWDSFVGHDANRWAKLNGTPIADVLPVKMLDHFDARDGSISGQVVNVPPALATANLKQFPGAGGYQEMAGIKPGATEVLRTNTGKPLLVVGSAGEGKTAAYTSTPFGGWPVAWDGWSNFYGSIVAYCAGTTMTPAQGTAPDSAAAGSMYIGCLDGGQAVGARSLGATWSSFAAGLPEASKVTADGVKVATVESPMLELKPGESKTVTFLLTWYFPNHHDMSGKIDGNHYNRFFRSATDVATKLAARLPDLEKRTWAFHSALYDSSLPYWLADALAAQLSTFTKASWWTAADHFGIWEGMNTCCGINTIDVGYYGSWPITMMFPELQDDFLSLTAKFQRADGWIPHSFAGGFSRIDGYGRIDLPMQYILPVYRQYLYTGNLKLLRQLWPHCVRAADCMIHLDKNGDGLPEHTYAGDQTYDGWDIRGESAYIGGLWLASLRALEKMGQAVGDEKDVKRFQGIFKMAQASYERLLWTGSYYRLWQDPATGEKDNGLMLDATNGQWTACMLGLGDILPRDHVIKHLRMCLEHNRLPVQNGMAYMVGKTGHCYVNCVWLNKPPKIGGQAGSPWTGTEYAFASLCIYEGLVKEGLQVARDVYSRYNDAGMTWDHVECGGHYFRPMDAWCILMALQGMTWNAPAKELTLHPVAPALRTPLVLPQGWGTMNDKSGTPKLTWAQGAPKIGRIVARTSGEGGAD